MYTFLILHPQPTHPIYVKYSITPLLYMGCDCIVGLLQYILSWKQKSFNYEDILLRILVGLTFLFMHQFLLNWISEFCLTWS